MGDPENRRNSALLDVSMRLLVTECFTRKRGFAARSQKIDLGPVNTIRAAAKGADFFECEKRRVANTGLF